LYLAAFGLFDFAGDVLALGVGGTAGAADGDARPLGVAAGGGVSHEPATSRVAVPQAAVATATAANVAASETRSRR
jgi:hypothetical protein